ncbi:MAG: SDR family NAD(P)-dependent oxidoreductase, partial [Phycisphaerae bacterium]|nr:SDR family NAD(P)-dependent oxidoreductase [Phycisphaerae bacterium]
MMKVDLTGVVTLVTGAARNIGKAISDVYAQNGAKVIYADVLVEQAKEAAAGFPGCKGIKLDVTDEGQVDEAIQQAVKEFGRLDIVVNNAGVNTGDYRVNIDKFPLSEWNRLVSVDMTGLFLVSRAA